VASKGTRKSRPVAGATQPANDVLSDPVPTLVDTMPATLSASGARDSPTEFSLGRAISSPNDPASSSGAERTATIIGRTTSSRPTSTTGAEATAIPASIPAPVASSDSGQEEEEI